MATRSPIVCVLGHVDHGKTSLLDRIRGTAIAAKEPGLITQHVGASFIPTTTIEERAHDLLKKYNFKLKIPGLLFIDTPGHEAFTNLRKRGGSAADMAILVVDIMQGVQPQTEEAIEILKTFKTPFIVAANKIDLINGWQVNKNSTFIDTLKKQRDFVKEQFEKKLYNLVGELGKHGFDSDLFTNVSDPTKQIMIIPVSAKTGEGFSELLMFLAGLSQKFMEKKLEIHPNSAAIGTVLEVKEVTGLGMTIDVIIYDGVIREGDTIALAGHDGPFTTKVRALMKPAALEEIRDPRKKFKAVNEVYAASGVKISAPDLEKTIPGSPLRVANDNEKDALKFIKSELESVKIHTMDKGVIVKAEALGSLEAIINLFQKNSIPVKIAEVGNVGRKDIAEAESIMNENRYLGVIFTFNQTVPKDIAEDAEKREVKIFSSNIIYKLEEDYQKWKKEQQKLEKTEKLEKTIYPAKLRIIEGTIFRASNPAVVGVEVLAGIIRPKYPLMREDGKIIGKIVSIQDKGQTLTTAEKGAKVAVSIDDGVVGRNIEEGMILFTAVPREQVYELLTTFEDRKLMEELKKVIEGGRR